MHEKFLTGLTALLFLGTTGVEAKPLKEAYAKDFAIGVALPERYLFQQNEAAEKALGILECDFNCITSENLMKPASRRPALGEFNFEYADRLVKVARRLDLDITGHVLVWHSQTPRWFFEDKDERLRGTH